MYFKEILKKCEEENYPLTRMGLYEAGVREGFLFKVEGSRNYNFDKAKFLSWLNKVKEPIPEGWIPIKELPNKFNISLSQAYILSKDEDSGARNFGSGKGVTYVDPRRIEEIIKRREDKYKINWEE